MPGLGLGPGVRVMRAHPTGLPRRSAAAPTGLPHLGKGR